MSIQITTSKYESVHGKKPSGRGAWIFYREPSHGLPGETVWAPAMFTYREACAWIRQDMRKNGWPDATVHTMP